MKNLLVPSDMSEASINALDYAMNMAVVMDSKVTILYAYQPMPVTIDGFMVGEAVIEREVQEKFDFFCAKYKRKVSRK